MHPNVKLARKFSKYYPPIKLPANKNDWHIGHYCLADLEKQFPRRDLLIPTLLDCYDLNRGITSVQNRKKDYLALIFAKEFKDISKLYMLDAYSSLYKNNFIRALVRLSGKPRRLLRAILKADRILDNARMDMASQDRVINGHICNCGEMARMTHNWLTKHNIPSHRVCLRIKNKKGRFLFYDHVFCLIRTDNKKLTFKQMLSNLYHPNTLVVDWWLGRCGHPTELFNIYTNFFKEDKPQTKGISLIDLQPGTKFLLYDTLEETSNTKNFMYYLIGHVSSKTPRIFCGQNQNVFSPVCMPYQETAKRFSPEVIQNQHIRD